MITFITTAYKETVDAHLFISSLLLQTDSRWKCIIVCDGRNTYLEKVVAFFGDGRITVHTSETPTGFWGHYNRKYALENLVDTEFTIQTSIQDYYLPVTVAEVLGRSDYSDFIYYDSIHNHCNYNPLNVELRVNKIDWGNFAIRTSIAKAIGIKSVESSTCDGLFVEGCLKYPGLRITKLDKILTVHN